MNTINLRNLYLGLHFLILIELIVLSFLVRGGSTEIFLEFQFSLSVITTVFMSFFYIIKAPKRDIEKRLYNRFLIVLLVWFFSLSAILLIRSSGYSLLLNKGEVFRYAWGGVEAIFALEIGRLIPRIFRRREEWE